MKTEHVDTHRILRNTETSTEKTSFVVLQSIHNTVNYKKQVRQGKTDKAQKHTETH